MSDSPSVTCFLLRDAPLQARNTFHVPAKAARYTELRVAAALPELLQRRELKTMPLLVLGDGSNLLFTRDFDGLVLHMASSGVHLLEDGAVGRVRVAAGESWHGFVRWSLHQGFTGLENLALIPGTVGAAPIQNIGAYGAEVREFITMVEAWDRRSEEFVQLDNAACGFAYRDSVFKRDPQRFIVTAVDFALPRERPLALDYSGVRQELEAQGVQHPTPADVAHAVETLRRRKLPDPAITGNAGSFFKNPLLTNERAAALAAAHPELPQWPGMNGSTKVSAAWLIEACGFKGVRDGDAGVSPKHSLVLINYGHATGAQVWALAGRIRDAVAARFGITLEPEPVIV
ncbi:MAG TPA: UDP-N-acetylmuramate dehydrogenase [Gammaproteobacteria bacterium]|nr:UDP-N-acetylmuramate dehydrogenase [Gammaproteobacteria bacterium]